MMRFSAGSPRMVFSCGIALFAALCVTPSWAEAAGVCDGINGSAEKARARMISEVVNEPGKRSLLVQELQKGGGGRCREILNDLVGAILEHKDNPSDKGRAALLLLALSGRVPRMSEVLQMEIREGRGEDLLASLAEFDGVRYRETLFEWVRATAAVIRSSQDLMAAGDGEYGARGLKEEDAGREKVRLASPLLFERALRLVRETEKGVAKEDVASLNVIFAASTSAYRQAFLPDLKTVMSRHVNLWIPEFRREPVWVQARLFPLMTAIGGPEVVRELLWLSKNHADLRIRGLAEHALDAVLQGKAK